MNNGILWTDETHSVLRGCDPVSPGCAHCWAAAMAARFSAPGEAFAGLAKRKVMPGSGKALAVWTDKPVMLLPDKLLDLLSWRKPKRVFLNSVSDTFHADVPFEFIAALWAFMACSTATCQIVTKRARRMREFFEWTRAHGGPDTWLLRALELCDQQASESDGEMAHRWRKARETLVVRFKAVTALAELTRGLPDMMALENVWLLVSTENQETYDERVAELLQCPAVVRGISAEPLLGPIELGLGRWVRLKRPLAGGAVEAGVHRLSPYLGHGEGGVRVVPPEPPLAVGGILVSEDDIERLPDIDWAIIGGESRPCELQWVRDLTYQISEYNRDREDNGYTAPFLKQLGGAAVDRPNGLVGALHPAKPKTDPWVRSRLRDGHGGDEAEFPASLCGYRHFPIPRLPTVPRPPAGQLGLAI